MQGINQKQTVDPKVKGDFTDSNMKQQQRLVAGLISREAWEPTPIDDYAKDGGPGEVWLLCSFAINLCALNWNKVSKFAISNQTALKLVA